MMTEHETTIPHDAQVDPHGAIGRLRMVLSESQSRWIQVRYREKSGYSLAVVLPGGERPGTACAERDGAASSIRWQLVTEALRWGEPSVRWMSDDTVGWGFPLMLNNALVGGLIVEGVAVFREEGEEHFKSAELVRAATTLRDLALESNLCHRAWLDSRRDSELQERRRAEAIHSVKGQRHDSVREVYLRLEPDLLRAIRDGNRPAARSFLNEVLTGIYFFGEDRLEVLKSYLMELVVMMNRTAVEAGADPSDVLGLNYSQLSELYSLSDEEELSTWSRRMLEALIDAIRDNRQCTPSMLITRVQTILRDHMQEDIGRDEVARMVGVSPSHFSRLIKQKTGYTFSEMLLRTRVEKARVLLRQSELPVGAIAERCGFYDQSYFSKIFRKAVGLNPVAYRNRS